MRYVRCADGRAPRLAVSGSSAGLYLPCLPLKWPANHVKSMPKANPSAAQAGATSPMPATYEAAMEELERLASELESGAMPLDAVLGGYKRGAELLQFCRGKLESVEEQIKVLEAGMVKPWTPE